MASASILIRFVCARCLVTVCTVAAILITIQKNPDSEHALKLMDFILYNKVTS